MVWIYGLGTGENQGSGSADGWFRIAPDGSGYQVPGLSTRPQEYAANLGPRRNVRPSPLLLGEASSLSDCSPAGRDSGGTCRRESRIRTY